MKWFHKNRLLKLAAFLDKLPDEKFNFEYITNEGGKPMLEALKAGAVRCGTTACALGWAPAVFPRELKWARSIVELNYGGQKTRAILQKNQFEPEYSVHPWDVTEKTAQDFFGLTKDETTTLFVPGYTPRDLPHGATPKMVAEHIRKFVKSGEK